MTPSRNSQSSAADVPMIEASGTARHTLITGMSGVGKTSVIDELRRRGLRCIDMDEPGWSCMDSRGHQHWNAERLAEALRDAGDQPLVVSGCAEEQARFYPAFRHIILLSAPRHVMIERIRGRDAHAFGHDAGEMERILDDLDQVEPLLRKRCTHEIRTTVPVSAVVDEVLERVGSDMRG